jgi:ribosome-binding factor A
MARRVSRRSTHSTHRYPRSARVNEVLREVLADALERLSDVDERLDLVTVTAVACEPDLRHAQVFLSSLDAGEREALEHQRARLQAAVSREVRLKRTPQLSFAADPAVASGQRVDDILLRLHQEQGELGEPRPEEGG